MEIQITSGITGYFDITLDNKDISQSNLVLSAGIEVHCLPERDFRCIPTNVLIPYLVLDLVKIK